MAIIVDQVLGRVGHQEARQGWRKGHCSQNRYFPGHSIQSGKWASARSRKLWQDMSLARSGPICDPRS